MFYEISTTRETMHSYYLQTCSITCKHVRFWEIRKYQESMKTSENDRIVFSPSAKMEISLILAKITWKTESKLSPKCAILHAN